MTTEFDARTGLEVGLGRDADGRVIVDSSSWNHAGQLRTRLFGPAGADGELEIRYNSKDLRVTEIRGGTVANTGRWQRFQYAYDKNRVRHGWEHDVAEPRW